MWGHPKPGWLLVLCLLILVVGTASTPPALAAWPVDQPVVPGVSTSDVTVAPDHRVGLLEGTCSSSDLDPFSDLSPAGDPLWSVPAGGDLATLDSCLAPFYDHAGNAYFTGIDGSGGRHLVSYDAAGALRWSVPLLYGLNVNYRATGGYGAPPYPPGPGDIAEGADGNIYLLDSRDLGYSTGLQIHLRSFDAATGASLLDINLETGAPDQVYPGALLQTSANGVLVGTNAGARFYSYAGQLQWTGTYWGGNTGIPDLGLRDRTPDGGFVAMNEYPRSGTCSSPSSDPAQIVIQVDKVTPSGLAWSTTFPVAGTTGTCMDAAGPIRVHGTPDGGAIVVQDPWYSGRHTLTGIGPNGIVRWTLPTDTDSIEDVRVGGDGTAVVIEHATRSCAVVYTCGRLLLHFISTTTGAQSRPDILIDTPDPSASALTMYGDGAETVLPQLVNAQADTDRLVIAYSTTNDPGDPNAEYVRIDAIPVPGLGSDVAFNSDPPLNPGPGGGGNPAPPPVSQPPAGMALSLTGPSGLTAGQVGSLTAHVTDPSGDPVSGTLVSFSLSGPNSGSHSQCAAGAPCSSLAGNVQFSYRGAHPGTDHITAWIDLNGDRTPTAGEPQATVAVSWKPPPGNTAYVAMGDSFSSGEGLGAPYEAGTDDDFAPSPNHCHRNTNAYGPLLSRAHGLHGLKSLTFVACSGATTDDLIHPNIANGGEPAQITRVGPATKTITLTIGGNDLGFADVLTRCVTGPGNPHAKAGCTQSASLRQDAAERLAVLAGTRPDKNGQATIRTPDGRPIWSLPGILKRLHAAAPQARIYFAGYPHLFGDLPDRYTGDPASAAFCRVDPLHEVAYEDAQWINLITDELDLTIKRAVANARASHIAAEFVDVIPGFAGHGLCDAKASWINGLRIDTHGINTIYDGYTPRPESFHPTHNGQTRGYAANLRAAGVGL